MNKEYEKVFVDSASNLVTLKYDPQIEYFKFISSKKKDGYSQFIITSDIMLELLKELVVVYNYQPINLRLQDEDLSLTERMDELIADSRENSASVFRLIEELKGLSDNNNIDIAQIALKHRQNKKSVQIRIQTNGLIIIEVSEIQLIEEINQMLLKIIKHYYFGE